MNENRVDARPWVRAGSLRALGVAAVLPVAVACTACTGTGYPPQGYPPGYPAQPGYAQPPPGYPAQPGAPPPGYPAAYPQTQPTAYPQAQPGYAPAPGAPSQPQPAYAPAPGYPTQPGYAPAPQQGPAPAPAASSATPPLAPVDPNTLQGILQGLQGALGGQMVAPGSLTGDLAEAGLKAQAMRVAPGMKPEGDELKQTLTEGQHAVMMISMQAGKCYAILGFSPAGGVKNLDLNMLAPPLYLWLAGQDLTHNNTPTIGAAPAPMCPGISTPVQYKLDVFAQAGSGEVAVQLYSKNK
jgi:hypothetical protein